METRRLASVVIAAIAALLVMFAGKSCAQNIEETNRKSKKEDATFNQYNNQNGYDDYADYGEGTYAVQEQTELVTEAPGYGVQTVTNLLGDVVATITVTTTTPVSVETKPATTVSKSILESYNEKNQQGNNAGGSGGILDRPQETTAETKVTYEKLDSEDIVLNVE